MRHIDKHKCWVVASFTNWNDEALSSNIKQMYEMGYAVAYDATPFQFVCLDNNDSVQKIPQDIKKIHVIVI